MSEGNNDGLTRAGNSGSRFFGKRFAVRKLFERLACAHVRTIVRGCVGELDRSLAWISGRLNAVGHSLARQGFQARRDVVHTKECAALFRYCGISYREGRLNNGSRLLENALKYVRCLARLHSGGLGPTECAHPATRRCERRVDAYYTAGAGKFVIQLIQRE